MNENELKNYLAAQEIITDNVLDKHVYKIAKNEEGDITSDDLEINNDKLEIFINFAFEKYFLKKRNIRGAENINRQEITNYINFEDETATHLNNLAINLKDGFANTLRRNQELVLVILLFEIGENKGLLFLTFAPEEYMGIIDGEISTSVSFIEIKKGFIKLAEENTFLLIDNQNTKNPADYFSTYLGCTLTERDEEITMRNKEEIFNMINLSPINSALKSRMKFQITSFLKSHNKEIFNIDNLIEYLINNNTEMRGIPEDFYENFKNIFEENENILTKDFPIKIVKTYEKVTLKINNQSNVVIKAFEEEIAKFRISEDGTELIMQIDNINADRVNEIRGKYSSQ